jgi:D-galactarolactone isomerase
VPFASARHRPLLGQALRPVRDVEVGRLAKALVKKAPERMLWASNWPHPSVPQEQRPSDEDLLDLVLDWAPEESARHKMLVDNPAELYGFQ